MKFWNSLSAEVEANKGIYFNVACATEQKLLQRKRVRGFLWRVFVMFLCYSYMYRSKTNLQGRVYFHLASGYGLAPPMQSWLAKLTSRRLLKSLHSVYCPSHPHCSSGVIKKPVGWSTLLAPQVTLVSTRITQNSLQDAQLLPFSSQGYRTWQRIQIISCFRPIEWNKNASWSVDSFYLQSL